MRIMMVSGEMSPFAKVGGLADVTASLSRALAARGHDVRVVLPLYGDLSRTQDKIRPLKKLPVLQTRVGQQVHDFRFHVRGSSSSAVKIYLVECEELFGRQGIYLDGKGSAFSDALDRSVLHAQAALMLPSLLGWPVDILHCHDAEAAPAILFRRHWYTGRDLPGPAASILTIHNLAHQEIHPLKSIETLGMPRSMAAFPGLLEFHGQLNLMKAGILSADMVNTVSPTYAEETLVDKKFGVGLEGVLASRGDDYLGILNGGDYETWDPARDDILPARFGPGNLDGKLVCRRKLLKMLGLSAAKDKPLCGFVGRLAHQKGLNLLLSLLERLAADGFAFAFLGTGEPKLHKALAKMAKKHPNQISFTGEFSEKLAHLIYAGSDVFLMPSLFEPCGLSQMYALKYGTVPVVRKTGGLADTVLDVVEPGGNGFVFDDPRPSDLMGVMRRVENLWADREAWRKLQDKGMAADFSWEMAATGYEEMYRRVLEGD
ncbi:MAG: glycogen synthase [Gemmatimonadales bacterium]|nr:glycogen synthase [Gemmatimonadales bacterium]